MNECRFSILDGGTVIPGNTWFWAAWLLEVWLMKYLNLMNYMISSIELKNRTNIKHLLYTYEKELSTLNEQTFLNSYLSQQILW